MILNLFAGPGGWCTGVRWAGYVGEMVGIEWDAAACATARAAGHDRIQADVSKLDPELFAGIVRKVIGSPPCPTFSMAGDGGGRALLGTLATAMTRMGRGRKVMAQTRRECTRILRAVAAEHPKFRAKPRAVRTRWAAEQARMSVLVLEPLRWVLALRPEWIALEQVPAVLPLWKHMAAVLAEHDYRTWAGVLSAEEYGVPQTRKRAILTARLGAPVYRPEPTHQPYRAGRELVVEPDLFGDPLPPPMSMADALGWGLPERPAWTVTAGGTETGGAEVFGNAKNRAELREVVRTAPAGVASTMVEPRPVTDPAHTLTGKATAAWLDPERQSVRVTVQEAGILQSFPVDYPWQGTKSQQYRQVGDAMPPRLAAAVIQPLVATKAAERAA